ncbi:MAG: LysR family transcriptional regulator [Acidobacteriota bacterium]
MHIESLKVFCDLIDTRSFSKAAAKNFISQSAVSQQIRAFEEKFERQLVERSRKGLVPTAAGLTFYKGCREILDRYNALEEELKTLGNLVSGQVRVATIYSVGLHEISPIVKNFIKNYPQANLHIEYSRANKVYDDVINGTNDIGIVAYPKAQPQLEIIPYRSEPLSLICYPEHPLAKRKRVDIEHLKDERLIGYERDIPSRKALDKIFRTQGITPNYVMEFDNIEIMKLYVESGQGITILPATVAEAETRAGTLKAVKFTKPYIRSVGIIYRKGRIFSTAARKFLEMLVASAMA